MACKTFFGLLHQRAPAVGDHTFINPPGGTTDPLTMVERQVLQVQAQFLVTPGTGQDCTGWLHYSQKKDGGVWFDYAGIKIAKASVWAPKTFYASSVGSWKLRAWLEYLDGPYYSTEIDITVTARPDGWVEKQDAALSWDEKEDAAPTWSESGDAAPAAGWEEKSDSPPAWVESEGSTSTWSEGEDAAPAAGWEEKSGTPPTWEEKSDTAPSWSEGEGAAPAAGWVEKGDTPPSWTEKEDAAPGAGWTEES